MYNRASSDVNELFDTLAEILRRWIMNQTYFSIVSLIVSFLGGGIVSALINWVRAERADKKERRIRFLDDQIRKLYGPLYYFVSQSEKLFELNKRFHDAYTKEYVEKKYSIEEYTRKILEEETKETLDIANKYIAIVENNNLRVKEILNNNYSLIDPDDIELFLLFYEDHIRLVSERDEEGRIKTPLRIYQQIGHIAFLRPEVIERVKKKFLNKKKELEDLLKK